MNQLNAINKLINEIKAETKHLNQLSQEPEEDLSAVDLMLQGMNWGYAIKHHPEWLSFPGYYFKQNQSMN